MSNCIIQVPFSVPSEFISSHPSKLFSFFSLPCVTLPPSPKVEEGERKREKKITVLPLPEVLSLWWDLLLSLVGEFGTLLILNIYM